MSKAYNFRIKWEIGRWSIVLSRLFRVDTAAFCTVISCKCLNWAVKWCLAFYYIKYQYFFKQYIWKLSLSNAFCIDRTKENYSTAELGSLHTHFGIWVMLIIEYPSLTVNCRTAIKLLFLFFNICLRVNWIIYYVHVHTYSFLLPGIDQVFLQINNSDLFNILCIGTLPSEAFIKCTFELFTDKWLRIRFWIWWEL